jgi:hypothetical protein
MYVLFSHNSNFDFYAVLDHIRMKLVVPDTNYTYVNMYI